MRKTNNLEKALSIYLVLTFMVGALSIYLANAVPQGATIATSPAPSTDTGPTRSPDSRNDSGGTITTMNLNLEQQNTGWKAYVGNVSGVLVLQNVNNQSIYEWTTGALSAGEVYVSRNESVNFTPGAISCASVAEMNNEQDTAIGLDGGNDSINVTFDHQNHTGFTAGTGNVLAQDTCFATGLWVNNSPADDDNTSNMTFQEIILHDGDDIVYAALIANDQDSFDNATQVDFQLIVPENRSASVATRYYFYLELS